MNENKLLLWEKAEMHGVSTSISSSLKLLHTNETSVVMLVNGDVVANVTTGIKQGNVGATINVFLVVSFATVDEDDVETIHATATSDNWNQAGNGGEDHDKVWTIEVPVDNILVKPTDSMRIIVKMYGWGGSGTARTYVLAHDPMDRADPDGVIPADTPKTLNILIPFKPDL